MDELIRRLFKNNQIMWTSIYIVSCLTLSGGSLVLVSDKSLFIEFDLFKLLFIAITPSLVIFLFIFLFVVIKGLGDNDYTLRIIFSSTITAFYNFIWSYFIFVGFVNSVQYIHWLCGFVLIGFIVIIIAFIKEKKHR